MLKAYRSIKTSLSLKHFIVHHLREIEHSHSFSSTILSNILEIQNSTRKLAIPRKSLLRPGTFIARRNFNYSNEFRLVSLRIYSNRDSLNRVAVLVRTQERAWRILGDTKYAINLGESRNGTWKNRRGVSYDV